VSAPSGEVFDYVVVGGGTAGCVVAARLAEEAAARVLLLERGADVRDDPSVAPGGFTQVLSGVPLEFLPVETITSREPKLAAGLARTYVPRALGGGPAVSGSFWGRGDPANYDEWARLGAEGWAYDEVLPYFKRSESFRDVLHPERAVSADRGIHGPIQVAPHDDEDPSAQELLAAACATFGVRRIADYNTRAGQEGFAPMQRTLGHDLERPVRSTSYTRYVEPALAARPNLRVVSTATATRLRIEGGRATGVDYLWRGQARHAAAREVVLCAGTIHTARLLLLSGVGPAADLERAGVEPVVDLPGVGQNLQDHAVLRWAFRARAGTLRGAAPSSVFIGFLRSPESKDIDVEVAWGVLPGDVVAGFLVNVRNERRGVVQLTSPDPLASPFVRFDWDPGAPEMAAMAEMFRRVRRWLSAGGCASELAPGEALAPADGDAARWRAWFAAQMGGWYHMAGTARMGGDGDRDAVVDAALRVRGVPNLRIADCSVMPRVVSSHPSATAAMIGEKAADLVRGILRAV
jgi:choline dehydrogenase